MKNKHMILSDRIDIETGLNNGNSIRKIGRDIDKPHTTILHEISMRKYLVKGNNFNLLPGSSNNCIKLEKSPYVCNSCDEKRKCRKNKYFYYAKEAQHNYNSILVDSRSGIDMECDEFQFLSSVTEKEVKDQSHSFYMLKINNEEIKPSVRTLYRYQEKGYLPTKNIDLPRKVRYKTRKKKSENDNDVKPLPNYRVGRAFKDWKNYQKENNIQYYFQMDTVEGVKGKAVLLTFIFLPFEFFLSFKLENQTIECVNEKINYLKETLGQEVFHKMFPSGLTDNGKEFKDPVTFENNGDFEKSKLFYCDPGRSDQKGSLEVLHQYPRRYIDKGQDITPYSDEDILKMNNNINSIPRASLNGKTAYELMAEYIGSENLEKLGLVKIENKDVILNSDLFKNK